MIARVASWSSRVVGLVVAAAPFAYAPLAARGGRVPLVLDDLFASVCHRMPERSFSVLGSLLPLCSRCLGLYVGAGLGLLVGRPALDVSALRLWLTVAAAALFVELFTQDLGWHPVFHPTRILTGFFVAYPLGAFVTSRLSRAGRGHG